MLIHGIFGVVALTLLSAGSMLGALISSKDDDGGPAAFILGVAGLGMALATGYLISQLQITYGG